MSAARDLPNRRPHFICPIEWAGVSWVVGVGLDAEGIAREVFIDLADAEAQVDQAIITSVHEASITVSHLLQRGVRVAVHAERLSSHAPGYLALALRAAARVEAEEGEKVRCLEAWRAARLSGEEGALERLVAESVARFAALDEEAQEAELAAQRESWVRGEMGIGLDRQEAEDRARMREQPEGGV